MTFSSTFMQLSFNICLLPGVGIMEIIFLHTTSLATNSSSVQGHCKCHPDFQVLASFGVSIQDPPSSVAC